MQRIPHDIAREFSSFFEARDLNKILLRSLPAIHGLGEICDFRQITRYISEMVLEKDIVSLNGELEFALALSNARTANNFE